MYTILDMFVLYVGVVLSYLFPVYSLCKNVICLIIFSLQYDYKKKYGSPKEDMN